jgi:hypothetical protein
MSSENDLRKKSLERELAERFVEARAEAIDRRLSIGPAQENPDFQCWDDEGNELGLEVTQVTNGPEAAFWTKLLNDESELNPFDASAMIFSLLERKERARAARYSKQFSRCILLLALGEVSIQTLKVALEGIENDFNNHGFEEVWLADFSGLEAYGNIELFGLFPSEYWGHHIRPNAYTKPYG